MTEERIRHTHQVQCTKCSGRRGLGYDFQAEPLEHHHRITGRIAVPRIFLSMLVIRLVADSYHNPKDSLGPQTPAF